MGHWKRLRTFIVPVEIVFFLYVFSMLFQTFFYQQYYFQRFSEDKLLSLPNYTSPGKHICLTQDYIVKFTGNVSFVALQKQINNLNMYSNIVYIASSFCSSILLGPLSDRFGRKPVFLIVLLGLTLDTVLQILVVYFHLNPYYFLVLLAIHGLSGGIPLALGTSFAIVTDTTPKKWLGIRMSTLEACISFGKAVASLGTNNWIHSTGCNFLYPSILNLCTAGAAVIFLFLMNESFSPQKQVEKDASIRQGILKLLTGIKIFFYPYYLGFSNWWRVWAATGVICLGCVCAIGGVEILNFFLHNRPLQWSYDKIGYFGACTSGLNGLLLIMALPLLIIAGLPYPTIGLIGVAGGIIGNVTIALVKFNWEMYIAGIFLSFQTISFPAMRVLLEDLVSSEDRGAIFSASASFQMFGSVFASILFNQLYQPETEVSGHLIRANTVFWVMVAIWGSAIPLLLSLQFFKTRKSKKSEIQPLLQDGVLSDSSDSPNSNNTYGIIQ